jgi:hypothetical protein
MASSTTKPMESTIPRSVSTLMEKSIKYMIKNTPMSEIGMVTTGIKVVRQSLKKSVGPVVVAVAKEAEDLGHDPRARSP